MSRLLHTGWWTLPELTVLLTVLLAVHARCGGTMRTQEASCRKAIHVWKPQHWSLLDYDESSEKPQPQGGLHRQRWHGKDLYLYGTPALRNPIVDPTVLFCRLLNWSHLTRSLQASCHNCSYSFKKRFAWSLHHASLNCQVPLKFLLHYHCITRPSRDQRT